MAFCKNIYQASRYNYNEYELMPYWNGNNYNRRKELQKFVESIDEEQLRIFGAKKTNKSFMTKYNKVTPIEESLHNNEPIRTIQTTFININKTEL